MATPLNFRHLYYFWVVAKEGSMSRAADRLDMAVQSVSAQVRALEQELGHALFKPAGRSLALTEGGEAAMALAEQIFQLGEALPSAVRAAATGVGVRLRVGISDGLPKLAVRHLLRPAVADTGARLLCHEDDFEHLLADLADARWGDALPAAARATLRHWADRARQGDLVALADLRPRLRWERMAIGIHRALGLHPRCRRDTIGLPLVRRSRGRAHLPRAGRRCLHGAACFFRRCQRPTRVLGVYLRSPRGQPLHGDDLHLQGRRPDVRGPSGGAALRQLRGAGVRGHRAPWAGARWQVRRAHELSSR